MQEEQARGFFNSLASYFSLESMLPRFLVMAVIVIISMIICRIISRMFKRLLERGKISSIFASLMRKTLKVIVWVLAAIAILQDFGINLTPVIAGLGVSGVVLGLALQETIGSFFSGLIIAVKKPFEIGDYVTIDGTGGTVRSMDMMGVTLTTPDNKLITMSNKNVWGSVIVNTSALDKRRVDLVASVGYDADYDKAREIIKNLLATYPEVLPEPAPVVEVHTLADSTVDFTVRPWVKSSDYWTVYWRFNKDIIPTLEKNGIDVPYERLDISIKQD